MKKLNFRQRRIRFQGLCAAFIFLLSVSSSYSQNPEWINYTNGNSVYALVEEGNFIWAGTNGGLVKIDKTSGASFFYNKANSGLPDNNVLAIAIDVSGNKWIGTVFGGLAVYKEGGIVSVQEINNLNSGIPKKFALEQNYPNPFNPVTVIQFEIPKASEVKITIYNILGERIKTLVSGYVPAGSSSIRWDSTNEAGIRVSSGMYLYQMTAGNTVITRRMILIK
jgi:hypothetical protein